MMKNPQLLKPSIKVFLALSLAILLGGALTDLAYGLPLMMQLTIDKPSKGLAVVSGDIDETTFGAVDVDEMEWAQEISGTHWNVHATLNARSVTTESGAQFIRYSFWADAFHKTAPHPGETSPGLTIGGFGDVLLNNLGGLDETIFGASNQTDSHDILHPGGHHRDAMKLIADDLNQGAGFLSRDNQVSIRIELAHTPEPSTVLLLGASLFGLGLTRLRVRLT